MDVCLVCTEFIKTETISVHDHVDGIPIKHILLDLNYKVSILFIKQNIIFLHFHSLQFPLQEHDGLCVQCCSSLINLYNVREGFSQFFDIEPKSKRIGCAICSEHHPYMRTLSHYVLTNRKHFKLFDIISDLCGYEVDIEKSANICDKCCECLKHCYTFHLNCIEALKLWVTYDVDPESMIKFDKTVNLISEPSVITHEALNKEKILPELQEHLKIENSGENEKKFQCSICWRSFTYKSDLKCHLRTHTDERPYPCTVCPKSFRRAHHLKDHLKRHKGEKPFKCETCFRGFTSNSDLKKHLVVHRERKPSLAGNEPKTTIKLEKKDEPNNEQLFECEICSETFKFLFQYKQHTPTHKERNFKCPTCSKSFLSKGDLTGHERIHTDERPFPCTICTKSFRRLNHLKDHMRTHTGEKPFKCHVCSRPFAYNSDLKKHILLHREEKPFPCSMCEKSFKRPCDLKVHMRLHTGERPYTCEICSKSFNLKSTLKTHMVVHDVDDELRCEYCAKKFRLKTTFQKHILTHIEEKG